MSKNMKIVTKIISVFLAVIMFVEVSPTNAMAAFVANVSGSSDNTIEDIYSESRNFYYDYHSIDVGRAGTLSVNDYTLAPSVVLDTLGIDGNIFPVNISMRYNPTEYRFLKNIVGLNTTAYGNGWLTNYSSSLCELQYEDELQIAYLTGSGNVILFEQSEFNENDPEVPEGTTKWTPVSGSFGNLVLYKAVDETALTDSTLINGVHMQYALFMDNMMYAFDLLGRLAYCKNTETSASISVNYATNGNSIPEAISKITDGVGNEYRFVYTDNLLTKIKCYTADGTEIIAGDGENAAPLEMNFAYANGRLTTAIFPDGKSVSYKYNPFGNLISVTNIDGYKAELSYRNGNICKLAEYALDEDNEYISGGYINISWDGNSRTFTDDTGEVQTKNFDDTGKIISIVDGDGNYLYGEPVVEEEYTGEIITEEVTGEAYTSVCPCEDCTEWECSCECESEEICTCIQCKRYSDTIEDESGNVLAEEFYDGNKIMKTQNTYTSDGNYLESSVDTSGNTVYYVYDEAGFLDSLTSSDMNVLFDYDAMGNLTQLSQQVSGLSNGTTMSNQYTYTDDKVTSITHNGFSYNFTYDEWGNQTEVKINDRNFVSYEYDGEENNRLSEIIYANGQSVTYTYDNNDNIIAVSYDGGETNSFEYEYNSDGTLSYVADNKSGYVTMYSDNSIEIYSLDNVLMYSAVYNEDGTETENIFGAEITYTYNSDYNQVTGKTVSEKSFSTSAVVEDEANEYSFDSDVILSSTTDWFGRTESKDIVVDSVQTDLATEETEEFNVIGNYSFEYADTDDTATTKVLSHSSAFVSDSFTNSRTDYYEYDATGNITGIYRYVDGVKTYFYTYVYDEAGQLVRENMFEDNKTIIYVYDVGGNIVSKTEYEYTLGEITENMLPKKASNYTYGDAEYKDLLTGYTFTESSETVNTLLTYDAIGNVTSFNGNTYTWSAGRQLESATTEDGEHYKYYYNENGFLIRMDMYEDGGTTYTGCTGYIWDGDVLKAKVDYNAQTGKKTVSSIIYDADGENIGIRLLISVNDNITGDTTLLYRKNLQGDITGLINSSTGELVASYTYDAYGTPSVHPTNDNQFTSLTSFLLLGVIPQLYRGYIYSLVGDEVCYYLGSRFYSPKLGRFLNADKHFDTETGVVGTNMYAYCNNNPVMFTDPSGEIIRIFNFLKAAIALIRNVVSAITSGKISTDTIKNEASWPVKEIFTVNSPWGFRHYDYKHHQGIDIPVGIGTPVFAIADGIVVELDDSCKTSQGVFIVLKHEMDGKTFYSRYMHLRYIQTGLVKGQSIAMGDQIGVSGNTATGGATGQAHLHFQIQLENTDTRSKTINPLSIYHNDDARNNMDNPNPFFVKKNGKYVFNESFSIKDSYNYFDTEHWSVSDNTKYQT